MAIATAHDIDAVVGFLASKKENQKSESIFDLEFDHSDIVAMMNDPQVLLNGGTVSSSQVFQIVLKRANGAESVLKDMNTTDTIIFRFTTTDQDITTVDFTAIDIT